MVIVLSQSEFPPVVVSKAIKMDEVEVECKPGTYPILDDIIVEDDLPTLLLPCIICNKTFRPEALQRHSKVCEKNATKKRKTFDSFKQRVQGTELAEFLPFSTLPKKHSIIEKPSSPKKTSSRWKENHEAFVSAIRAARGEGTDAIGGSGEPRSLLRPSDHEQCPYCERHFGPKSFDRHQEWCREQHSRHPPVTASLQAKERLEARIKYRAPPIKSKRAITREKYSPLVQRKVRQVSPSNNSVASATGSASSSAGSSRHSFQSQQEQSNRLSKSGNSLSGRSQTKEGASALGFNRGMAGRTSLRASQRSLQRSGSPGKLSGSVLAHRPSHEEARAESHGKEDILGTVTQSCNKKLQTRNHFSKVQETKVVDSQKMKTLKKPSPPPRAASNSQTLNIDIKLDEQKENTNNNRSPKNDQLWRQDHHSNLSGSHNPSYNSLVSATSSCIVPRGLLKTPEKEGKSQFSSKFYPIRDPNCEDEMVIAPHRSPKVLNLKSNYEGICVAGDTVRKKEILCSDLCTLDLDSMYEDNIDTTILMESDSASLRSFKFCSPTGTPASSSHSGDSNRTYITQSSAYCELDHKPIPFSKHNMEIADKLVSNNAHLSFGLENGQSYSEATSSLLDESNSSKRESGAVHLVLPQRADDSRLVKHNSRKCMKTSSYLRPVKSATFCCEADICPGGASNASCSPPIRQSFQAEEEKKPFENSLHILQYEGQNKKALNDDVLSVHSKKFFTDEDHLDVKGTLVKMGCRKSELNSSNTTWNAIAMSGCRSSQYIVFNTYSKLDQTTNFNKNTESDECILETVTVEQRNILDTPTPKSVDKGQSYRERVQEVHSINAEGRKCCSEFKKSKGDKVPNFHSKCSDGKKNEVKCFLKRNERVRNCSENKKLASESDLSPLNVSPPAQHKIYAEKSKNTLPYTIPKVKAQFLLRKNPSSIRLQPLPFTVNDSRNRLEDSYDPYASAERQMMELLRSDSAANVISNGSSQAQKLSTHVERAPSPSSSLSPMPSPTLSPKPSPLETSPTSAFTRYAKESEFDSEIQSKSQSEPSEEPKSNPMSKSTSQHSMPDSSVTQVDEASEVVSKQQLQSNPHPCRSKAVDPQASHQPQPPPRSYKRLASVQVSKKDPELMVCGSRAFHAQLQSSNSLDVVLKDFDESENLDNRPKTYDVSHNSREIQEVGGWFGDQPLSSTIELPTISDSADSGKVEILNIENNGKKVGRRETRESREIREITERESNISEIDSLLEEVVRMQRSVSLLSDVDSPTSKEGSQAPMCQSSSSAKSRRNRTGKMHIEDFLFPAELLVRENNNFGSSDQSKSVFGSTKSRKSSSKGRRLIEDLLFPPGTDFNANSDNYNEDGDVIVSANALSDTCTSLGGFSGKGDSFVSHLPTSPVSLTSKAPSNLDDSNDLPRPKPVSLSTHSSTGNGCCETNVTSPIQPLNQGHQSNSSRLSGDSAYSSLNRRSPIPHVRRQCTTGQQDINRHGGESPLSVLSQSMTQSLVLSSSGSESSLPPLTASQSSKRVAGSKHDCDTPSSDIGSATTPILPKLSKFCHQCGTKFLIPVAKFCHECGAPRLEVS